MENRKKEWVLGQNSRSAMEIDAGIWSVSAACNTPLVVNRTEGGGWGGVGGRDKQIRECPDCEEAV